MEFVRKREHIILKHVLTHASLLLDDGIRLQMSQKRSKAPRLMTSSSWKRQIQVNKKRCDESKLKAFPPHLEVKALITQKTDEVGHEVPLVGKVGHFLPMQPRPELGTILVHRQEPAEGIAHLEKKAGWIIQVGRRRRKRENFSPVYGISGAWG